MIEKKENEPATALNIVILPSDEVAAKSIQMSEALTSRFSSEFTLNNSTFRPHITIYQGYFPNKNLDLLRATIQKLSSQSQKFPVVMSDFWISPGRFVWWDAKKSLEIMDFHQKVMNAVNPLREGLVAPPALSQLEELGERERQNVLKTGAIYHGDLYVPHITLTRLKSEKDREEAERALKEPQAHEFEANQVLTASLGDHGTISTVVGKFLFGK